MAVFLLLIALPASGLQRLPAAWVGHVEPRATALCAASPDGGGIYGRPNWRLAVQRARDPGTGREESRLALEPTDGRWAARQIEVEIEIEPSGGLGIELSEFASTGTSVNGKRVEGSLVLATGIVPGGGAWAQAQRASDAVATVQPGDAIVGVADGAGAARVSTEGASFDEVVAAIGSVRERSDTIRLSVKRMVRRGVAQVTAMLADGREIEYEAYDGENLRMGLLSRGQKVNDMTSQRYDNKPAGTGDCGGNGLCCTCVVSVTAGLESLTPKKSSERQLLARSPGRYRQSCKARVSVADDGQARLRFVVGPMGEASIRDAEALLGPEWRR